MFSTKCPCGKVNLGRTLTLDAVKHAGAERKRQDGKRKGGESYQVRTLYVCRQSGEYHTSHLTGEVIGTLRNGIDVCHADTTTPALRAYAAADWQRFSK